MRTPSLIALSALALLSACNQSDPPVTSAAKASFDTTTGVKELMGWMIDPSAGALWASTGSEVTAEGTRDFAPATDEEWNRLRGHAVIVAESGNLMMMDGRARDQGEWITLSRAMTEKAHAVLAAIEAKAKDDLFAAGGDLYQACTDCHSAYMVSPTDEAAQQ